MRVHNGGMGLNNEHKRESNKSMGINNKGMRENYILMIVFCEHTRKKMARYFTISI